MYFINKISSCSAVDYAAEELRKYLRMMMPECGNVEICYNPKAKDGFRLGLMQDFGLDVSDAEEPDLDDILYIDTDTEGGIIAGDNPRSVLLAVYEYLRQNGCRWLMPGVDGEFIPMQDIASVKYRHKPSCRYRGQCNEGAEYQSDMIDAIEFTPKVGMNVFMMEFFNPVNYYAGYYQHSYNEANRTPEPVSDNQVLQWKRQCEAELSKRGLMFHDIGHGWTAESFGINTALSADVAESTVTDEERPYLALVNGERKLYNGRPNWTQACMSNPEARRKIAKYVAEYAENHTNSDYLHVWLADGVNNHCECEECKKMLPSDYYVKVLNEIDAALTEKNLNTRIVYIAYTETLWAPKVEKLKNPGRFALLFAPISREYSHSLEISGSPVKVVPYKRNDNVLPKTFDEIYEHFKNWTKDWNGANFAYEYHFWRHQVYDVGGISLANVINKDIKFYKAHNINGTIQDGSQRSFFPTGLSFYTYARTLFDVSLSFDEIAEDYMSCAFGEDWRKFYDYLEKLGETFGHDYLSGDLYRKTGKSAQYAPTESILYDPSRVEKLQSVRKITEEGRKLIAEHYNSDFRVRTVSVRLLELHALYAELFADALIEKAKGNDDAADVLFEKMRDEVGKHELAFERWYDQCMFFYALGRMFKARTVLSDQEQIETI
ncbi:MAG: DUF4838 domain-containing protein [Ruminococcaceae bacterium]|nr:DUF4838 domain-containing protein [Oscillospiraceae bacterium]